MTDDFAPYPDVSEFMAQRMAQRIADKKAEGSNALPPAGTVDPYKLMLQRKQGTVEKDIDPSTIVKWPEDSVARLQDYCTKMGIVGFSCGRMNPIAALAMLKKQFGDDYTNVPLEERIPEGYEKRGTLSSYGPNYPYSEAIRRKQIIHG